MKKREYKEQLYKVFDKGIENMDFLEKMCFIHKTFLEYQRDNEDKRDTSNKGEKWTDEQLKIILSDAPTQQNCIKYATLFKRGYGSIEQIYRWSTTQDQKLSERRKEDSFIQQIKKLQKNLVCGDKLLGIIYIAIK